MLQLSRLPQRNEMHYPRDFSTFSVLPYLPVNLYETKALKIVVDYFTIVDYYDSKRYFEVLRNVSPDNVSYERNKKFSL